jgi:hypothetical protein
MRTGLSFAVSKPTVTTLKLSRPSAARATFTVSRSRRVSPEQT